jgi:hypothetical protein
MLASARVLALDLSGTVGWCVGRLHTSDPEAFGARELPTRVDEGERFAAFRDFVEDTVAHWQPALMILEAPMRLAALAERSTIGVVTQQMTLRGIAFMEAWHAHLPQPEEVSAERVRKALLGRARFPKKGDVKTAVVDFCHAQGWQVSDHNAADACLTWAWRARQVRKTVRRRSDFLFDLEGT